MFFASLLLLSEMHIITKSCHSSGIERCRSVSLCVCVCAHMHPYLKMCPSSQRASSLVFSEARLDDSFECCFS